MKKRFTRIMAALALLVFMMPSMAGWGQQYTLVKNISELSQGDVILITNAKADGSCYALGTTQNTNNRKAESVTISSETISTLGDAQEITLETMNTDGDFTFQVGSNSYLYAASSSANQLKTRNTEAYWGVVINTTSYVAAITDKTNSNNRNKMKYNANNGNPIFSCYSSADNNLFVFKKTTGGSTTVSMPTFSPANGATFEESLQVTLNQAEGKDIYYNINSESDPDANSTHYTVPFSISATSTIKAIAIDGENSSSVATATYTKLVYNNISDIIANQTQYTVKGTVVAKNSRGFVMGDGTGYVYYYKNAAPAQAIGDVVTISGTTSTYGHILQFPSGATVGTATSSNYDGTPSVAIVDATVMAEYNEDYQLSDYVQYEGYLTKNGNYYDIAVGTATARISYPTDAQSSILTELLNKTVRVKGYFAGISTYNSVNYFTTMLESIEEVQNDDPILNVTPTSLTFTYTEGATEVPSKTITITGSNLTQDVTVTLPTGNFTMYNGNNAITSPYTLSPSSEGEINETITVKMNVGLLQGSYNGTITIAWEDEEDITIALTGTVAAPEAPHVTWDLSTNSYVQNPAPTADLIQWTSDYASMKNEKGTGTPVNNYIPTTRTSTRFYGGNILTIAPTSGYAITSVEFTATSDGYASALASSTWNNATATASSTTVTVTPTNGDVDMVATIGGTCGFTAVTVYYTQSTLVYYDIELLSVQNGSIATNPNRALAGTTITLTATPNEYFYVDDWTILDDDANSIEWTDQGTDKAEVTFTMPASNVTVEAIFATDLSVTTYSLATTIESGKHYIITNGTNRAMGAQTNNNRSAATISINNGIASVVGAEVYEFVINGPDANGNYIIYDANEESTGYLYAIAGNNYLRTQEFNDTDGEWTISFDENKANIQVTIGETTRIMRFNNSNNVFSCYTSGQQDIYLYVKDNDTNYEFYKDIAAYQGDGGYYLIASPVNTTPVAAGMITDDGTNSENYTYDLYYYDQAQELEWRNYRAQSFELTPGTGYLYANKSNVTLAFTGTPYAGNGEIDVVAGWNLIGNPFSVAATLNEPYYRLNDDGSEVKAETETGAVNAMEGVFVNATAAGHVTFSTTDNAKSQSVALNVSGNRGNVIDRAIVRFDEGDQLPKFQLNPNNTKIYFAQADNDYAVVRSASEGEMPVSFRASENGTYTLSFSAENTEMRYMHLIDNMTGNDIDLLQTPSYSFEAKTTDYANRFRIVFNANNGVEEMNEDQFAFFNGSEWVINNEGEATLQVIDMMGRVVSSQTVNGNANVNINEAKGVYVIRLIQNDLVKTQKIVKE
jgi:hypothetical protein